jgi:hypothetical protein
MPTIDDHAVVLGASMGGLFAARVLTDTPATRQEVPQEPAWTCAAAAWFADLVRAGSRLTC